MGDGAGYGAVSAPTHAETDTTDYNARAARWSELLFKYLLLVQVAMYLEAGAVPSLLQQFTLTFALDPQEQGLLGAVVFLSLALTSPWCSTLFRRFSPRSLLGGSLVANNLAVLAFGCAPTHTRFSKPLLIGLRGVIGVSQAFHCVYCPLWVHDYAPKAKRGKWMSYLQGAVPIGITLGYLAGSITLWLASARVPAVGNEGFTADYMDGMTMNTRSHPVVMAFAPSAWAWATNSSTTALRTDEAAAASPPASTSLCRGIYCWRWPFLFQFALVLPLSVLLFLVPTRHIRLKSTRRQSIVIVDATEDDGHEARDYSDTDAASSPDGTARAPLLSSGADEPAPQSAASTATSSSPAARTPPQHRRPAMNLDLDAVRDSLEETVSRWSNLGLLLQHKVYVFIVMGLSALFFVVAGVQFWTTLYLETNTDDSLYEIHASYLLVSGTGPIMGVFFGGWLIDRCGGYTGAAHQAKALRVCMLLGGAGCLASLPVSYVRDTLTIAVFLWLMLFCGGAILPACSGIVISSAPARLRPLASSVAYACYNLFGYAASNYLPGLIMNYIIHRTGDNKCDAACTYRIGFRIVLLWSVWAFFCLTCGAVASARSLAAIKARQRAAAAKSPLLRV